MRIKRVCYPVHVLGPGERLGIWVTGCKRRCPGCMTPELQDEAAGNDIPCATLLDTVKQISGPISGVTISGGEPFDQPEQLHQLVSLLCQHVTDDIIVYTGYTLQQLQGRGCRDTDAVLNAIAVLIDGAYIEAQNDGVGLRGSANQTIHAFRNPDRYAYMNHCKRELQIFNYQSATSIVGLL